MTTAITTEAQAFLDFQAYLHREERPACPNARMWCIDKTAKEAWHACTRIDWLLWWLGDKISWRFTDIDETRRSAEPFTTLIDASLNDVGKNHFRRCIRDGRTASNLFLSMRAYYSSLYPDANACNILRSCVSFGRFDVNKWRSEA